MGKLTRIEKRKLYSGDKTILYEKLGLVEESDIEKYKKKLGLKNLGILDEEDVDSAVEASKLAKEKLGLGGKKKPVMGLLKRKKEHD